MWTGRRQHNTNTNNQEEEENTTTVTMTTTTTTTTNTRRRNQKENTTATKAKRPRKNGEKIPKREEKILSSSFENWISSDILHHHHHHHHHSLGSSHGQQHFTDNLLLLALAAELIDAKGYDEVTARNKSASGLTHPDPRYNLPYPDSILEIAYWAGVYDPDFFPRP